jgi:hypothetical protein
LGLKLRQYHPRILTDSSKRSDSALTYRNKLAVGNSSDAETDYDFGCCCKHRSHIGFGLSFDSEWQHCDVAIGIACDLACL